MRHRALEVRRAEERPLLLIRVVVVPVVHHARARAAVPEYQTIVTRCLVFPQGGHVSEGEPMEDGKVDATLHDGQFLHFGVGDHELIHFIDVRQLVALVVHRIVIRVPHPVAADSRVEGRAHPCRESRAVGVLAPQDLLVKVGKVRHGLVVCRVELRHVVLRCDPARADPGLHVVRQPHRGKWGRLDKVQLQCIVIDPDHVD